MTCRVWRCELRVKHFFLSEIFTQDYLWTFVYNIHKHFEIAQQNLVHKEKRFSDKVHVDFDMIFVCHTGDDLLVKHSTSPRQGDNLQ